ncbi:ATP-binding cassette domain-containing protein [Neolewinella agarilytica]|uniref:Peptide/nickel transport system ATP-binding protein n=1 Tax=Neolewinella agarilytica TaxID=478744 RepID=A0A1H8YW87_9BACT|nr:ABC transporter ATP-binding protein [Neolewinella agarilytica]SEP56321.1 peptide/nickel transport system ATP-binding protein [Neolewinella agarilytica]
MPLILDIQDLTIAFGDNPPVVDGVTFTLEAGEQLGVLGLSGSGKSMTALACLGLLPPEAKVIRGSINYYSREGQQTNLLALSEKEWSGFRAKEISLVFQEPLTALNPVHRVRKQLTEAIQKLLPGISTTEAREHHLREWLARVELPTEQHDRILSAYPHELSGGQRQRLLIALALLAEPGILFADEPTTALDTITETGILDLLARLRRELNMTTVFITHDLDVLRRTSDRLLVMRSGKIIREGKSKELITDSPEERSRLFRVPGEEKEVPRTLVKAKHHSPAPAASALTVSQLKVSYRGRAAWPWSLPEELLAVRSVNLHVDCGEWVALVGPSGCGKSSIARCLAGLVPKLSGEIKPPANGNIQLVFQDPFSSLNPSHTVLTALREVLQLGRSQDTAESLLAAVGLPATEYGERLPAALSGGQRQRVAIAKALAAGPGLLIADEAVSALDVPLRKDILALLNTIRQERNIGLLFISHDLKLVAQYADRVLVMEAGQIVEEGPAGQVLAKPESEMGKRLVATKE